MPCPYFAPVSPRTESEWFRAPRSPLGVLHTGECRAAAQPVPSDGLLCNTGYARDACPSFPKDANADAVRFMITQRTAESLELLYVFERANSPTDRGTLRYQLVTGTLTGAETRPILAMQARQYVVNALSAPEPASSTAPSSR